MINRSLRMFSVLRKAILAMTVASAVLAFGQGAWDSLSLFANRLDPAIVVRHRLAAVTCSAYETEIRAALAAEDAELARSLADLAVSYGQTIDPVLLAEIVEAEKFSLTRSAGEVYDGFIRGETGTFVSFTSSVIADQIVIGDLRDLSIEASNYPDYDGVTVALASVGIAASAATLVSGPAARVGASFLKAVKKGGAVPPHILKEIALVGQDVVDLKLARKILDEIPSRGIGDAASDLNKLFRPDRLEMLMSPARSLGTLVKAQGFRGASDAMKRAERLDDLPKLNRLSEQMGSTFRGGLHLLKGSRFVLSVGEIVGSGMIAILKSIWLLASVLLFLIQLLLKPIVRLAFHSTSSPSP
ncbi:hypothetical protein [Gellertiella hungarica]|uniref:Uncharacterized protein n=1 Tax=Gellertiella hungarica TaxID=1572859 RepID=A0A7W6J434_9HYPH|nr:hypothetical protein [Gellertiella hungarica]MBB4064406.1 hypothetical protein [Gellertiella hungarica]